MLRKSSRKRTASQRAVEENNAIARSRPQPTVRTRQPLTASVSMPVSVPVPITTVAVTNAVHAPVNTSAPTPIHHAALPGAVNTSIYSPEASGSTQSHTIGINPMYNPDMDIDANNFQTISKASDALGLHVTSAIKEKICKGDYIDLAVLIQNNYAQHKPSQIINLVAGELVIHQKQQQKISNIEQWTDAFVIFMSIYGEAHPNKMHQLLKYFNNIRIAAKRCGAYNMGWKTYDENFRFKIAQHPHSSWGDIDLELWLMFVNQNSSVFDTSNRSSIHKCYAFNYNGTCNRTSCTYSHSCIRCFAPHPLVHCYKAKFAKNFETGQSARAPFRPQSYGNVRPLGSNFRFTYQRPRTPGAVMGQRSFTR